MARAVTGYKAFGVEGDEPISSKAYVQYLVLDITAAATDVSWDIGAYLASALGSFWTDADGTAVGLEALKLIRQIGARADAFNTYGGLYVGADLTAVALVNKAPNFTFDTASAPTSLTLTLSWVLQSGVAPIYAVS